VDAAIRRLRKIKTYSEELGLDLNKPEDRFKWFLASMLFARRISSQVAKKTFKRFQEEGLLTPEAILEAGWDKLVKVLDSGGYVRYDFSTATNLLDVSKSLLEKFGSIDEVHEEAESSKHLEELLASFRGIGPVGVNIFLRELRGVWSKADPEPSKLAVETARRLGVKRIREVESQLVRLSLEYCRRKACEACPVSKTCLKKPFK
jgi:endonuclease III